MMVQRQPSGLDTPFRIKCSFSKVQKYGNHINNPEQKTQARISF